MANKYEHLKPKNLKKLLPSFVDPPMWIMLRRNGETWGICRNAETQEVLYWKTEQEALFTLSNIGNAASRAKRTVRRLYKHELEEFRAKGIELVVVEPAQKQKKDIVAKKISSIGNLVDVYEDLENRKFAVASKAGTEAEFITEVAQAMSANHDPSWAIRLRELLPLIVDMCCKYRGYKAELVYERRELVAGDLEMPQAKQ